MSRIEVPTHLSNYYEDYVSGHYEGSRWVNGSLVKVEAVRVADIPAIVAAELARLADEMADDGLRVDPLRERAAELREGL